MRKHIPARHLSGRIGVLAVLQGLIVLLLAVCCLLAGRDNSSGWPLLLSVGLACQFGLCAAFYFWVLRPYRRAERRMELFLEGYSLAVLEDITGVNLSPVSERMMCRVREEFNASHLLKFSKRQAQYRALQNQINPHFLYNTLESIRSEALVAGLDSVADMTEALAVFFRYTISKLENLVTVEEELQNCDTYFRIQQYRFGPRLSLSIECDPEDKEEIYRCRIPKLTLQPILENGIIHGTEFKIGAGKLTVRLERTEKLLNILVSDDGMGMNDAMLAQLNRAAAWRWSTSATGFIGCLARNMVSTFFPCPWWAPTCKLPCLPSQATASFPGRCFHEGGSAPNGPRHLPGTGRDGAQPFLLDN